MRNLVSVQFSNLSYKNLIFYKFQTTKQYANVHDLIDDKLILIKFELL